MLVEVQSAEGGRLLVSGTEEEREVVGFLALVFHQIALGLCLGEGTQYDIVGQEVGKACLVDVLDMEGVTPDGVLAHVGLRRGYDDVAVEGYFLTFLREHIVAVGILQRIDVVLARSHAFHHEVS